MTIKKYIICQIAVINVVTPFTHRDFNALQRSTNAKYATNTATFQVYAPKRRLRHITRAVAETPKHTNFMQAQCMHKTAPIHSHSEDSSSNESFCLQLQIQSNHAEGKQILIPIHLIMNLAY